MTMLSQHPTLNGHSDWHCRLFTPFLKVLEMMVPTVFPHDSAVVADAPPTDPGHIP